MLLLNFFKRKIRFFRFPLPSFGHVFPRHRDNFHVFPRAGKEIFLPVFIIFALFPGLFKGKILIFRNEFSVRTNIFSLPRGVFPDFFSCHPIKDSILPEYFSSHPAGIFTVPDLFRTNQTRAHLHARNNILRPLPAPFPLFRKTCRKTYLKHSILWIFLQKNWKKVWVKVGESEKVRNFAPAFERERRWRDDNLKGNGAGSSGSAAVQVSYLNGVKGARTAAGRSQLPPPKKTFWKKTFEKVWRFRKKLLTLQTLSTTNGSRKKGNSSLKDFR